MKKIICLKEKKWIVGCLLIVLIFLLEMGSNYMQVLAKIKYKEYYNPRFDYTIKYPAKFTKASYPANMDGVRMWTKNGDAELVMYGGLNHEREDGYSYYENYMAANRKKKNYSSKVGEDFARQGYKEGNKNVYEYVFFTEEVIVSFEIKYPPRQKSYYQKVIKAMKKSTRKNTNPIPYRLYQ